MKKLPLFELFGNLIILYFMLFGLGFELVIAL